MRWLAIAALLLGVAQAGDVSAHLKHRSGTARAGSTVVLDLELHWDGRPELHVPATPKLGLPRGASRALGSSNSSFDGTATTWRRTLRVTLPEGEPPFPLGPATIPVAGPGGVTEVSAAGIRVGKAGWRSLVGQGVGSALVVLAVLGWFLWRDRSLRVAEAAPAPRARTERQRAEAAVEAEPFASEPALEALLALALALEDAAVDNAGPATPSALRARLEALRFGGEETDQDACRGLLTALSAGTP